MKNIKDIKACISLKMIKESLEALGHFQWGIIPDSQTYLVINDSDVRLSLEVVEYKNRYMIKIEEIEIHNSNIGLGSMIMYIITKFCNLCGVSIGLWTTRENTIALNWYKKIGFKKKERNSILHDLWLEKSPNKCTNYFDKKLGKVLIDSLEEMTSLRYELVMKEKSLEIQDNK